MNYNLKFRKIPFGNGIGKQSLDEASFPDENSLTETSFLQAYRNWLTVIDIVATPDVAMGWYEHHSRMLRDEKFSSFYFEAWWDMDKQLRTQFITRPFAIDPYSTTYIQLLEHLRMDSFLAHAEKAQLTFESQRAARSYTSHSPRSEIGTHTMQRYAPYDKDSEKGGQADSFRETKRPILCLCCGYTGHRAGNCSSMQSNRPERPISCDWKHDKLLSKSNKLICVMFNVCSSCSDLVPNHGNHTCSLCGDDTHPACHCPRN